MGPDSEALSSQCARGASRVAECGRSYFARSQAEQSRFFVLQSLGPTGFMLRDEDGRTRARGVCVRVRVRVCVCVCVCVSA